MSKGDKGAEPAVHTLGENTKGFHLNYDSHNGSRDVFFTVTEPDWSYAKGTLVCVPGPNEFSELMGDQIEALSDAGYRVVTIDLPGTGRSSRDAQIGDQNLQHIDNMGESAEAVRRVMLEVEEQFGRAPGGTHMMTNSVGQVVGMNAIKDMPAGTVASLSAVSPVFDIDVDGVTASDKRLFRNFTADVDPLANSEKEIEKYTGKHLGELRSEFLENSGQSGTPAFWTKAYFNSLASGVYELKAHPKEYVDVLKNNDIKTAFIYDSELGNEFGQIFDINDTKDWVQKNKVDATITQMVGDGIDLLYNPERQDDVLRAVESNIENASPYISVINKLKTVFRDEWNGMSKEDRKELQKDLEAKGYSVGPTGIDATPRYGAVAYTEHAIAEMLVDADEQGKKPLSTFDNKDFTPVGIKRIVESLDVTKPGPAVQAPTVSGAAFGLN